MSIDLDAIVDTLFADRDGRDYTRQCEPNIDALLEA